MRKFLLIYSAIITLLLVGGVAWLSHSLSENRRLHKNQEALASEIEHYVTESNEAVATIQSLELRLAEFRTIRARDAERIREMGIALRRVESTSTVSSTTTVTLEAPLRDTTLVRTDLYARIAEKLGEPPLLDRAKAFQWRDNWVTVEGIIRNNEVECKVESVDTLYQVVHRVPHKFLFFRFGTKAIRQEIVSSNPHTRIVYAEYIELPKRRKKR